MLQVIYFELFVYENKKMLFNVDMVSQLNDDMPPIFIMNNYSHFDYRGPSYLLFRNNKMILLNC